MPLEVTDFSVKRGAKTIHSPNINLANGERLALFGKSGIGKTSLLLGYAGLLSSNSGFCKIDDVVYNSREVKTNPKLRGEKIGIVFSDFRLIEGLNVRDNILIANCAARMKVNRQLADELMCELQIDNIAKTDVKNISQGQAQRVAIARALINSPSLLLADEPTSSLDKQNAENLISLLLRINQAQSMVMIISTHDERIIDQIGNSIEIGNEL